MSESFEKAVEAAAILSCATFDQDRIWHNLLDEEEREDYRKDAAAMLTAALPHLTAEDVPHLLRQAKAEAWGEGYAMAQYTHCEAKWQPCDATATDPYAEEADHE